MMDPDDVYTRFRETMEDVNVIIATYNEWLMGAVQVDPAKGIVAFGPGLHGCGFNAERFANIYTAKMRVDQEKRTKRLWGDTLFNANEKTWSNVHCWFRRMSHQGGGKCVQHQEGWCDRS